MSGTDVVRSWGSPRGLGPRHLGSRQLHDERRSRPDPALGADGAAVGLDDDAHDVEAESEATEVLGGYVKQLDEIARSGRTETATAVLNMPLAWIGTWTWTLGWFLIPLVITQILPRLGRARRAAARAQ